MATGRAAFALTVALAAAPAAAQSPALRSVEVQATGFRAVWSDGTVRAGAALVGAVLTLAADPPIRLRIDAVEADPGDPDILLHRLSVREGDGPWRNLCEPDADGIAAGFPLAGASDDAGYDPDAPGFTLTCTSGAIGKCVRFGYKPWRDPPSERTLRDLHQACMRMVRADYCGDGRAHTRDGTAIDVYDRIGVQRPEAVSSMSFEAAWAPSGAVCVRRTRVPGILTRAALVADCPRLRAPPEDCDESAAGAILFNRSR